MESSVFTAIRTRKLKEIIGDVRSEFQKHGILVNKISTTYEAITIDNASDFEGVLYLDEDLPVNENGFVPANKLGRDNLLRLWEIDKNAFYLVRNKKNKAPIGYLDIFGINPDSNFFEKNLLNCKDGQLKLPDPNLLQSSIISRDNWNNSPIDIYIDAIIVKKNTKIALNTLLAYALDNLSQYPEVNVSRMATVLVNNNGRCGFNYDDADCMYRNKFEAAKYVILLGLKYSTYKIHGSEEGHPRILYVKEYSIFKNIWHFIVRFVNKYGVRVMIEAVKVIAHLPGKLGYRRLVL